MDREAHIDIDEVLRNIDSAEVMSVYFPILRRSLLVDARFNESGASGLMTVFRNADQWDRSNVEFVDGHIVAYEKNERTVPMQYIDYGLGMLTSAALQGYPPGQFLDLATVYQDLVARRQLAGFEVRNRFYEVGSASGLEETRRYLERSR